MMELKNEIDQQISLLQPLLKLLRWNIIRKGNDLYFYYDTLEVGRSLGFMNRRGPIYHSNDGLFDVFFVQNRLSLSLTREIEDTQTILQVMPKKQNGQLLLEFYAQHPTDKIDCFLRISETKIEMIESKGKNGIKYITCLKEYPKDIETLFWLRDDNVILSLLSSKIGSFLAPCNVICSLDYHAYIKKGKTVLKSHTFREESLEQVSKNIGVLPQVIQLQKELMDFLSLFLPGISEYLKERYHVFQQVTSNVSSNKAKVFQDKLSIFHLDKFEVPSIATPKKLK